MGEYALHNGLEIKIGTCEDLYYIRAEHAPELTRREPRHSDVLSHLDVYRFRFPFPDEDHVQAGHYDNYGRTLGLYNVTVPEGVEHGKLQFIAGNDRGFNVMLPCPEGPDIAALDIKVHRNGYSGPVRIVQQKVWGNQLILIGECGGCGHKYRYETLADVQPVIDECRRIAADYLRDAELRLQQDRAQGKDIFPPASNLSVKFWNAIADRIEAGYTNPPAWVASRPAREEN
jgi:hypothetical protein